MREQDQQAAAVIPLPTRTGWSAEAIVAGLREKRSEAGAALHERVGARVNRLVWRLLGADAEHDDVVHQVFVNALTSLHTLKEAAALDQWMVGIAVNTVRRELRRRAFRRRFHVFGEAPEALQPGPSPHESTVARRFYSVISTLHADLHIAYCLRVLNELTLPELAETCGCSLATIKRRLSAATREIERRAKDDPLLSGYLKGGGHED